MGGLPVIHTMDGKLVDVRMGQSPRLIPLKLNHLIYLSIFSRVAVGIAVDILYATMLHIVHKHHAAFVFTEFRRTH